MTLELLELPAQSTSTSESVATVEERRQVFFIYPHEEPGSWERFLELFRSPGTWWYDRRHTQHAAFSKVLAVCALGGAASPDRQTFRRENRPDLHGYGEALIAAVRDGRLVRSERLRVLAGEALAANMEPDDIETWARQLARDVENATD